MLNALLDVVTRLTLRRLRRPAAAVLLVCALGACDPTYNWRDYHSPVAPYSVLFPDKPTALTRTINLDGVPVRMTMEGAEINGTSFTVGSAQVSDAGKADAALEAMRTALLKNINGTVRTEKRATAASSSSGITHRQTSIEVRADGVRAGTPVTVTGRFVARDSHIFQILVLGGSSTVDQEQLATFMDSFKLND